MKRKASVAGTYYPRFKKDLVQDIIQYFSDSEFGPGVNINIRNENSQLIFDFKLSDVGPNTANTTGDNNSDKYIVLGAIAPHSPYEYAGKAIAHIYSAFLKYGVPDTIIILGNSHTNYDNVAIMREGAWETPLGDIRVDSELADMFLKMSDSVVVDESAFFGFPHGREHAIEVQLPFIKFISTLVHKEIKILPIKIGKIGFKKVLDLGTDITSILRKVGIMELKSNEESL
ncbi:MAG: AmmeMemoRadiSam system protein B, partial [Promethearchaeota archaeon]